MAMQDVPSKPDADETPPVKLYPGQKYGGWEIVHKLDEGGFGHVYVVKRKNTLAALKAESNEIQGGSVIKLEVAILMLLNRQGKPPHVPNLYHAAKRKRFCYMVVTLLGENLRTLRLNAPDERIRPETWSRLAIQCLYSIKLLHDVGFVHRDIKPANFVMGRDNDLERARLVHILDFGLSRSFAVKRNGIWVARRARETVDFRGTMLYCSPDVHLDKEQGRKDDIWSLMYMLIELHCGLPWKREGDDEKLKAKKLDIPDKVLMSNFPEECHPIIAHLRQLNFYNRPNYTMIHECFLKLIKKLKVSWTAPYDWEDPKAVEVVNAARLKRPEYEDAAKFFASDPLGINEAPPKEGISCSDLGGNPTVEVNHEVISMTQMAKFQSPKPGNKTSQGTVEDAREPNNTTSHTANLSKFQFPKEATTNKW